MKNLGFLLLALAVSMAGNAQSWISLNSGTTVDLYSICFTDTNIGYAVGASGTILKTTDGGASWAAQNSGTSSAMTSVRFCNADTGYIACSNGLLLNTTDGGLNWIHQDFDTINYCHGIRYLSDDTIFINTWHSILKTMDGGINWTTVPKPEPGNYWVCNSNIIYMVGGYGDYYKTIDGGYNWVIQLTSYIPGGGIFDLCFSNNNQGIAVGGGYSQGIYRDALFYTRDGGDPWHQTSSYITEKWFNSVFFTDDTTAYAAGTDGAIIKTTDTGEHYTELNSGTLNDLNEIYFVNSTTGFIAGNNGTILKTLDGPVGIPGSIPAGDFVHIYPNPFQDNVSIEIDSRFNSKSTTLAIYDARGILLMEEKMTNRHSKPDLSSLVPGIYFLKVTNPTHMEVIKLVKDHNP